MKELLIEAGEVIMQIDLSIVIGSIIILIDWQREIKKYNKER